MKTTVRLVEQYGLRVIAYEKGDEPQDAVDLPPTLINEWQKSRVALANAEAKIRDHLALTEPDVDLTVPW